MSLDLTIPEIVRKLETEYTSGNGVTSSDYVTTDLYTDINTIYAYLNSKHISDSKDSLGRDKPFFNIVLAARNVWFRATDIDRKDIILTPTTLKNTIGAFMLSVHLQDWMRKENFGKFLNTLGLDQAGCNSVVTKWVEKDGRLIPSVIPWSRLIVDQINFADNPKIEVLELTEQQLYDRYDPEEVERLCEAEKQRETLSGRRKDNKTGYYKVYEIHGKFPLSEITKKEKDEDTFVQQMHVISFVASKETGKFDDFTLYKGREEKDPYELMSLMPNSDGSISLDGAVKNLFEAQWMVNHTAKSIKDQLDLASKLIFQTSDGNYVGQNALFAIESGDIMIHQPNQPLTALQNNSHDVVALQNFGAQWKSLSAEINGISEGMLGVAPKAGTAWRQTEALLQESHSLFEIMTENKALDLENVTRNRILPFLKKKMNTNKEIVATLEMRGIKQIEERYIKYKGTQNYNNKVIEQVLANPLETPTADLQQEQNAVQASMAEQGQQRFFAPDKVNWKEELKDVDVDVEIDITGEGKDTQAMFTTLNTALQVIANPAFANNPKAQFVVDKILTATGQVSPVELATFNTPSMQTLAPGGGGVQLPDLTQTAK